MYCSQSASSLIITPPDTAGIQASIAEPPTLVRQLAQLLFRLCAKHIQSRLRAVSTRTESMGIPISVVM